MGVSLWIHARVAVAQADLYRAVGKFFVKFVLVVGNEPVVPFFTFMFQLQYKGTSSTMLSKRILPFN